MVEFPGENTVAGSILAVMLVSSPLTALLISTLVKPKLIAFFAAVTVSGSMIIAGVAYVISTVPGHGSEFGGLIFGGMAGFLSLATATGIVGGRALLARQLAPAESNASIASGTPSS